MGNNNMEIQFIDTSPKNRRFFDPPKPASLYIPEWYRSMSPLVEGQSKVGIGNGDSSAANTTLKACSPFLDALTAGYMWTAPADIEVRKQEGELRFRWRTGGDLVTEHTPDQHLGLPPVYGGKDFVLKWAFNFIIKTPPGYSTFFTHPLNRNDLPFRTFSGIVDTDEYTIPVQFPFQLIDKDIEDRIIIEEGTPLCQMFPIKREPWQANNLILSEDEVAKTFFNFKKKIVRAYKSRYWHKKSFT
jgi:hypothetical protein